MTPPALRLAAASALSIAVLGAPAARAEEVIVFAAASLSDAMARIGTAFEAATGHDLVVSVAGASALARQIEAGAPADIFISSSTEWMDRIEALGLIEDDARFDLLGNRLVLVAGAGAEAAAAVAVDVVAEIGPGFDFAAHLGDGHLAMALVDAVPAGIYGRQALESLGLWEGVAPQVAQADNVRAALAFVATGAAPLGIVYATDASAEPDVTVLGTFPEGSHAPIVYPAADLATRDTAAEAEFLDFLRGPEARAVFEGLGFIVLVP